MHKNNMTSEEKAAYREKVSTHMNEYVNRLGGTGCIGGKSLADVLLVSQLDDEGLVRETQKGLVFTPAHDGVLLPGSVYISREFMQAHFGVDENDWPTELCVTVSPVSRIVQREKENLPPEVQRPRRKPQAQRLTHEAVDAMAAAAGVPVTQSSAKKGSTKTTGTHEEGTVGVDVRNEDTRADTMRQKQAREKRAMAAQSGKPASGKPGAEAIDYTRLSLDVTDPRGWNERSAKARKVIAEAQGQLRLQGMGDVEAKAAAIKALAKKGYITTVA